MPTAVTQRHVFKNIAVGAVDGREVSAGCQQCCCDVLAVTESLLRHTEVHVSAFWLSLSVAFCVAFIYTTFYFSSGRTERMGTFRGLIN